MEYLKNSQFREIDPLGREYEKKARIALDCAKRELETKEDSRLKYAALELRMCIECVVYRSIIVYGTGIDSKLLSEWQPRRLVRTLLEIDYSYHKDGVFIAAPGNELHYDGELKIKSLDDVKPGWGKFVQNRIPKKITNKMYDKLGNFLHIPTIAQTNSAKIKTPQEIRKVCDGIASDLEESLSASLQDLSITAMFEFDCKRCQSKILKGIPVTMREKVVIAYCETQKGGKKCDASYVITFEENEWKFQAEQAQVNCPDQECDGVWQIWKSDFKPPMDLVCDQCTSKYRIFERVSIAKVS